MLVPGIGADDDGWETAEESQAQPVSEEGAGNDELQDVIAIDSDEIIQPTIPMPPPPP